MWFSLSGRTEFERVFQTGTLKKTRLLKFYHLNNGEQLRLGMMVKKNWEKQISEIIFAE